MDGSRCPAAIERHRASREISSTLDLPEHRNQGRNACERMSMLPLVMDQTPAASADALTRSREYVDRADFYLGPCISFARIQEDWRLGRKPPTSPLHDASEG